MGWKSIPFGFYAFLFAIVAIGMPEPAEMGTPRHQVQQHSNQTVDKADISIGKNGAVSFRLNPQLRGRKGRQEQWYYPGPDEGNQVVNNTRYYDDNINSPGRRTPAVINCYYCNIYVNHRGPSSSGGSAGNNMDNGGNNNGSEDNDDSELENLDSEKKRRRVSRCISDYDSDDGARATQKCKVRHGLSCRRYRQEAKEYCATPTDKKIKDLAACCHQEAEGIDVKYERQPM